MALGEVRSAPAWSSASPWVPPWRRGPARGRLRRFTPRRFFVTARPDEGYEYVLVLGVAAVAVAVAGPGAWSVDHALGIVLSGGAGAAACGGGALAATLQIVAFYRRVS
jgi:hypothetical protein